MNFHHGGGASDLQRFLSAFVLSADSGAHTHPDERAAVSACFRDR